MKILNLLAIVIIASAFSGLGQTKPIKIGYVYVEVILNSMPEFKQVDQAVRTHEQKISQSLQIKKSYYESKVEEYMAMRGKLTADQDKEKQEEIQKLEQEIKKSLENGQASIDKMREDQLKPLIEKLQKAIDEVADAEGYTYVFNPSISGNSILIKGPKEDDLTKRVFKKLNIEIPKEVEDALNRDSKSSSPNSPR